ncbi:MAG: hypothetical protein IRD7MM_05785 [Candidatus Midichloria mitochondrii]|nr:hypothetical protein [Candidatus Midichloria mitochondrii]
MSDLSRSADLSIFITKHNSSMGVLTKECHFFCLASAHRAQKYFLYLWRDIIITVGNV